MKISLNIAHENQKKIESPTDSFQKLNNASMLKDVQLHKQSKELESVFLTQLIKSMEKTIPEGFGGGKNTLSTMMFSSVMGDAMTRGGGIGLSKLIYTSLKDSKTSDNPQNLNSNEYLMTMDFLQNLDSFEEQE